VGARLFPKRLCRQRFHPDGLRLPTDVLDRWARTAALAEAIYA